MKAYLLLVEKQLLKPCAYTSLSYACDLLGVSYHSGSKGKRMWVKENRVYEIIEIQIHKIKGRGKK